MTIADTTRGEAMGRRVVRTARALGVGPSDRGILEAVHRAALAPREAALDDDHDPHYLHPGRTALILMLDTFEADPAVLAAALLAESERPELAADDEAVRRAVAGDEPGSPASVLARALDLRARLPGPDDPDLVETIVVAEPALGLVAVAERLDHARHAHMWLEGAQHARLLAQYEAVWGSLAERVHVRLGQRFHRWARGTRRKLEP